MIRTTFGSSLALAVVVFGSSLASATETAITWQTPVNVDPNNVSQVLTDGIFGRPFAAAAAGAPVSGHTTLNGIQFSGTDKRRTHHYLRHAEHHHREFRRSLSNCCGSYHGSQAYGLMLDPSSYTKPPVTPRRANFRSPA